MTNRKLDSEFRILTLALRQAVRALEYHPSGVVDPLLLDDLIGVLDLTRGHVGFPPYRDDDRWELMSG